MGPVIIEWVCISPTIAGRTWIAPVVVWSGAVQPSAGPVPLAVCVGRSAAHRPPLPRQTGAKHGHKAALFWPAAGGCACDRRPRPGRHVHAQETLGRAGRRVKHVRWARLSHPTAPSPPAVAPRHIPSFQLPLTPPPMAARLKSPNAAVWRGPLSRRIFVTPVISHFLPRVTRLIVMAQLG